MQEQSSKVCDSAKAARLLSYHRVVVFALGLALAIAIPPASAQNSKNRKPARPSAGRDRGHDSGSDDARHEPVHKLLLHCTAYIEAAPETGPAWSGTGWIVDLDRKLLITNLHVAAPQDASEVKSLFAWFPAIKDEEAIHELDYYLQNAPKVPLTLLFADATRDLAIVKAESIPDGAEACVLADQSAPTGAHLHSLGGLPRGSQGLFIYTQGTSRAVYKRRIATGGEIQVLETQMPLNKGNSGGPIINDDSQVVAVFEGLNIEPGVQLVNMCIDVSEVRAFLEEARPMLEPANVADFNKRGDHHYYAGRYRLALADFKQALRLNPKNAEAMSNVGWVHYQNGDAVTALSAFQDAIRLDSKYANAFLGRGTVFRDQGKLQESIADFTEAIRLAGAEDTAELYNERGNSYYAKEEYESALADYGRAIAHEEKLAWAHANSGDALAQLGRYDDAFAALDKAIQIEPGNSQFWNIAGNIWYQRERYDFAVNMYTNAIERDPTEAVYFRNRGSARRLLGQYEDAVTDLLKAVELAPTEAEYFNELGLTGIGAGKFNPAVEALTRAIELDSGVADHFKNRGHAYQELGNHQQAVADLTKAIELEDTAEWRVLRGNSYQALGNSSQASADYRRATEMDDSYKMFDRKYVRIKNESQEKLTVHLIYYTKTTTGNWQWFPDPPEAGNFVSYEFEPGETAVLFHDSWKVNATRIRLWAVSEKGSWLDYRDKDLTIAPQEGYLSSTGDFEAFSYSFGPVK